MSKDVLEQFVTKIEALKGQQKDLQAEITDTFNNAKSAGYDIKAMREVIKLRSMNREARKELTELTDLYASQLGVL